MSALPIAWGIIGLITWLGLTGDICRGGRVWRLRDCPGLLATLIAIVALWPGCFICWQVCTWRKEKARG